MLNVYVLILLWFSDRTGCNDWLIQDQIYECEFMVPTKYYSKPFCAGPNERQKRDFHIFSPSSRRDKKGTLVLEYFGLHDVNETRVIDFHVS